MCAVSEIRALDEAPPVVERRRIGSSDCWVGRSSNRAEHWLLVLHDERSDGGDLVRQLIEAPDYAGVQVLALRCDAGRSSAAELRSIRRINGVLRGAVGLFGGDPRQIFLIGAASAAPLAYRYACYNPHRVGRLALMPLPDCEFLVRPAAGSAGGVLGALRMPTLVCLVETAAGPFTRDSTPWVVSPRQRDLLVAKVEGWLGEMRRMAHRRQLAVSYTMIHSAEAGRWGGNASGQLGLLSSLRGFFGHPPAKEPPSDSPPRAGAALKFLL